MDGTILVGASTVRRALDREMIVLPFDADRRAERLGGYCRVGWGEGWRLDGGGGTRVCPMLVYVVPDRPYLYWAALVVPTRSGAASSFRLISDPGASDSEVNLAATDNAGDVVSEGLKEDVPFIVRGKRRVSASGPGYLALDLYGTASGVEVLVSAVSQSRIDVAGW